MKTKTKTTIATGTICLLFLFIGVFYLIFNYLTPVALDDWSYTRPGQTIGSIIQDQARDYMTFNGRFLAHGLVQFMGGIVGKPVVNILNAGMVVALIYLLSFIGAGYQKISFSYLFPIAVILAWFGYPDQYVTFFMIAGSFNYLWASVLACCFLVVYHRAYTDKTSPANSKLIAMGFMAFIIGIWGEMYAICLVPALFVDLLVNKNRRNKQTLVLFICFCIGAAFEILAPANFVRLNAVTGGTGHPAVSTQIVNILQTILDSILLWVYLGILILYVVFKITHMNLSFKEDFLLYTTAIGVYLLFVFVTGALWARVLFSVYTFSFLILLRLCSYIPQKSVATYALYAITILLIGIDGGKEIRTMRCQKQAIENIIEESTTAQGDYIPWTGVAGSRKSVSDNVLCVDSANWKNSTFSKFHNIPAVRIIPQVLYNFIRKDDQLVPYELTKLDEEFSVVMINDTIPENILSVHIPYLSTGYVFHNKIRRLVNCVGFNALAYRIYEHATDIPFGKFLLEPFDGYYDDIRVHRLGSSEAQRYITDKHGRTIIFINNNQLSCYKAPIGQVEVIYE